MVAAIAHYAASIPPPDNRPLTISRKTILAAVTLLCKATDRRSSLPVLADLLLDCHEGRQRIRATDLNNSVTYHATGAPLAAVHGVTVNGKLLADMLKSASGDDVILAKSGTGVTVASNGSDATLLGTGKSGDFPKLPTLPEHEEFFAVDAPEMRRILEVALHAVCRDETRFHLNGILLEARENRLTAVSTDGHRLIKLQMDGQTFGGTCILPTSAAKILCEILKVCPTVTARFKSPHLHVAGVTKDGARWEASFKTIDAQFPAYEQVIPKDYSKLVTVERKPLIAAMKRAKALCTATRGALLKVSTGKLTIVADHPESGSISEALKAEGQWVELPGSTMALGVNAGFMLEALDEIDCKHVTILFGGELDPMIVRGTEDQVSYSVEMSRQLEVIMPMRI